MICEKHYIIFISCKKNTLQILEQMLKSYNIFIYSIILMKDNLNDQVTIHQ